MLFEFFNNLFSSKYFIPHGHCYLWKPGLVFLHIFSDLLISLAYYFISIILIYLIYKRKDVPFDWMFLMFGAFIIFCGTSHVVEILTLWHPVYWFSGLIKAITALISVYTAALLIPLAPKILALPSTAQLEEANFSLQNEITERKRIEAALRDSRKMLQLVIDNIPQFIFWKDKDSRFLGCNQKLAQVAGLTNHEDIIGKLNEDLVWDKQFGFALRNLSEITLNNPAQEIHVVEKIFSQSFSNLWLEMRKITLHNSTKNNIAVLCTIEDVSEQKRAEDETIKALEKQKDLLELKSRFISTASHEFRTPLTIILSSLEILKNYLNQLTEDKRSKHLQRIEAAVKNMVSLLDDILYMEKDQTQKIEVNSNVIEVGEFCLQLIEDLKLIHSNHHIRFYNHQQSILANLDIKVLHQILNNLLSNAIKYSATGGNITLNLYQEGERIIFQVQDEGIGIPIQEQSQLFTPFYRASNVYNISGTGLGLSIVKKAVDLYQGSIQVESEVGRGTKITVILPANF